MAKQTQAQTINKVFMYISGIAAVLVLGLGGLAFWAHDYTSKMVRTELSAQKIYFPAKGDAALDPATYPNLQQYAGQIVDSPQKAKAYANGYIGRHLKKIADGKVYAEVSAESMKDPDNQKLQQQKQSLFQGETLRGMLLTSGYGFGTVGTIAGVVAYSAFVISGVLAVVAFMLRLRS